jgi:hypothetical protein
MRVRGVRDPGPAARVAARRGALDTTPIGNNVAARASDRVPAASLSAR